VLLRIDSGRRTLAPPKLGASDGVLDDGPSAHVIQGVLDPFFFLGKPDMSTRSFRITLPP